jgi:phosphate starvation-inducible PhoH-like protein
MKFILTSLFVIISFQNIFGYFSNIHHYNVNVCLLMKRTREPFQSKSYKPKSFNQGNYVTALDNDTNKIIIANGPAGTGKTLFACQKAIELFKSDSINKIVVTRPVVTVEEDIGFLPGNLIKKMDPWTKPLFDIFLDHFTKAEFDLLLNNNKIEICPLAFMRGRTFKNAFIIADEMQNSSPNQMKMLVTRLGENSRIVITGDLNQSDIQTENGLNDIMKRINYFYLHNNASTKGINIVEFTNADIERSEIVKTIISIYDNKIESKNIKNIMNNTNTTVSQNYTHFNDNYNSTQNNSLNTTKISNYIRKKINNDSALIPKQHITKNFNDVFFYEREF